MNSTNKPVLKIDWATHEAAKFACENWHYSKTLPVPPLVKIGVWENGAFVSVVLFSRGASSNLLKPYGLQQVEGCELTRVALGKHDSPVSRIVRLALIFLKKSNHGMKLVVSFADPHQGHHGGIYQAGGWIYCGETAPSREFWQGSRKLHSRQVSERGWNIQQGTIKKCAKPSECRIVITPGKHRYLMPLDEAMRIKIAPLSKPYPKRAKKQDSEHPSELGGAVPTDTLHLLNK